jgi:hypothetical protein
VCRPHLVIARSGDPRQMFTDVGCSAHDRTFPFVLPLRLQQIHAGFERPDLAGVKAAPAQRSLPQQRIVGMRNPLR